MRAGLLGCIDTPLQGNKPVPGAVWCADNGAFGKGYPGDKAWWSWVQDRTRTEPALCAFVVAPDVVGEAAATLSRSRPWLGRIRALGVPVAFVAQNGSQHPRMVPWAEFDVLFLGGSPECVPCGYVRPADDRKRKRCPSCLRLLEEWKLGSASRRLVAEAKRRGKRVHMGRVNSKRRYDYARWIGCDSADGTYITFGPDINTATALSWLRLVDHDPLFAVAAIAPQSAAATAMRGRPMLTAIPDAATGVTVRVEARLTHMCPHQDEFDEGTVVIEFPVDDQTLELHGLRAYLDDWADTKISHEELTWTIYRDLAAAGTPPLSVTTEWETAGMKVRVSTGRVSAQRAAA
jgi:NADPH-dependent 7-cyano-7-deazaguanine reductase QueF